MIGVRKSWLIAASMWLLLLIRDVIRSCIQFNALVAVLISSGPISGNGADGRLRPKLSAAVANTDKGALRARLAHMLSIEVPTIRNNRLLGQRPVTNLGGFGVSTVASRMSPSPR